MTIPSEFRAEADALPPALRNLLDAELAAGNTIVEAGSSFPAPPAGAFVRLAQPVTTRARASAGEIKFREFPNWINCGAFTDDREFYFILEPPYPAEPDPDMDAIRAAHAAQSSTAPASSSDPASALGRFERSMNIDYEKWHDGIGYDVDAIAQATAEERSTIQSLLLQRGARDWRDVEALAALETAPADALLVRAANQADPEIRVAVARYAARLVDEPRRTASLVHALESTELFGGLSQALDEGAEFHPPPVVEALLRGAMARDGEAAVHFAALLMFIHGKSAEPFDWEQRPFFLRFHTSDRKARAAAFVELCAAIGVDPMGYLPGGLFL